jgi:hypothetical protein
MDVDGFATIEEAWRARHKHRIYKWLDKNENFLNARSTFRMRQRKAQSKKLKTPTAEFVFLRLVVESIDLYIRREHGATRPREAIKRLRTSAYKHAGKLLQLFNGGLGLSSYTKQQELENSLRALQFELGAEKRKAYGGAAAEQSRFLTHFALQLLIELDLDSPAVIQDIGNMLSITRDDKACGRYVKRAKKLLNESLPSRVEFNEE